jgi:tetratricopeptide (TPR) repeat protein
VITKSSRFKAAISGASEVNYLSNFGHDQYLKEWEAELGLPWRESAKWLELSPYFKVENVTTPTLVVCGQEDWNVPLINSEQLYQALRRLGKTTELVIYPGEAHTFSRPSFLKDRLERYLGWFDRHVLGKPAPQLEAPKVEATSLLGVPLAAPPIAADSRAKLEENLVEAYDNFVKSSSSLDAAIWVGRRLGYLGRYREAIDMFSRGVQKWPEDFRFLRFRGHRYITVREPKRAVADLQKADDLIRAKGLKDAVEPDGVASPPGTTPSTYFFNVYYHLGLAHYLLADYAAAEKAYRECLRHSQTSPDSIIATSRWLYATLRHAGKAKESADLLATLPKDPQVGESSSYKELLRLYKGEKSAEQVLRGATSGVDHPTVGYGVGDFWLVNGQKERALELMREVVRGPQWGAFGFPAAEAELARNK